MTYISAARKCHVTASVKYILNCNNRIQSKNLQAYINFYKE